MDLIYLGLIRSLPNPLKILNLYGSDTQTYIYLNQEVFIMEGFDLISLISNMGFPIAITAYLLIRLEKQLTTLSSSINTLNTIVSVKLGTVVNDDKNKVA